VGLSLTALRLASGTSVIVTRVVASVLTRLVAVTMAV